MLAATAVRADAENPLAALEVGEFPDPVPPDGWIGVTVKAASLNLHDVWTLRGVGVRADRLPIVLGCDGAGIDDDGNPVVIHAVLGDATRYRDETLDPGRTLLSEHFHGTLAERVAVPRQNLLPKPEQLSFAQAACLPTAWLTAYRMLFARARLAPGDTVLVQGVSGGVASAAIALAAAAGLRVWATSRDEAKYARAKELGAHEVFPSGARLPERVDAVIDSVGAPTWSHSLRSLKPGGRLVTCGATGGPNPPAELNRVFFTQLSVVGSTMGSRREFAQLLRFLTTTGVVPAIDSVRPLAETRSALARMLAGEHFGKIVLTP
jgi:NADPH:quinone reductase-like Zn-dependent oxidoreductase